MLFPLKFNRERSTLFLDNISKDAWKIIVTTFESLEKLHTETSVTTKVTDVTFTEGLLRHIINLSNNQYNPMLFPLKFNRERSTLFLDNISKDAWRLIVTTFEVPEKLRTETSVTEKVTPVTFTENLLRHIINLSNNQQSDTLPLFQAIIIYFLTM